MSYVWDVFNTQPEFKGRSKSCRNSQTLAIILCLGDVNQPTETKAFKIKNSCSTFNETALGTKRRKKLHLFLCASGRAKIVSRSTCRTHLPP